MSIDRSYAIFIEFVVNFVGEENVKKQSIILFLPLLLITALFSSCSSEQQVNPLNINKAGVNSEELKKEKGTSNCQYTKRQLDEVKKSGYTSELRQAEKLVEESC